VGLPGPSPFANAGVPPRTSTLPGFETETIARSELARLRRSRLKAWLASGAILAVAGTAGYFAWGRLAGQRADVARLRAERGEVERKTAEARRDARSHQSAAAALERKLASWKPFADEASRRATEKQELERAAAELLAALKPELEGVPLQAAASDGRVTITAAERTLFAAGQTEISLEGYRALFRLAKPLKAVTGRNTVVVITTTDARARGKGAGAKPGGWDLAAARAVGVGRFLVEDVGWDPRRVTVHVPAPERPRKNGRAKPPTPRVEIRLDPPALPSKA
jgi:flagellar motor protein MotB